MPLAVYESLTSLRVLLCPKTCTRLSPFNAACECRPLLHAMPTGPMPTGRPSKAMTLFVCFSGVSRATMYRWHSLHGRIRAVGVRQYCTLGGVRPERRHNARTDRPTERLRTSITTASTLGYATRRGCQYPPGTACAMISMLRRPPCRPRSREGTLTVRLCLATPR